MVGTDLPGTGNPHDFAFNILLQNCVERQVVYERVAHHSEPTMPVLTLLSAEQRARLFAIPTESAEIVRHYTFGADSERAARRTV
jgi:hypothetical protein